MGPCTVLYGHLILFNFLFQSPLFLYFVGSHPLLTQKIQGLQYLGMFSSLPLLKTCSEEIFQPFTPTYNWLINFLCVWKF